MDEEDHVNAEYSVVFGGALMLLAAFDYAYSRHVHASSWVVLAAGVVVLLTGVCSWVRSCRHYRKTRSDIRRGN